MSEIPEGGQAFPCAQSPQTSQNQDGAPYQAGMTLRDYFAAQVTIGLLSENAQHGAKPYNFATLASHAFAVADAMLKAREA